MFISKKFHLLLLLLLIPNSIVAQPAVLDSLMNELQIETEADTNRVKLLFDVIRRSYRNQPEQATVYANEALEISIDKDYIIGQAHAYRYLGYSLNILGSHSEAIQHLNSAIALYEQINDFRGVAVVNGAIGAIYAINDDFELAIPKLLGALDAYKQIGNRYAEAVTYNNIGNIYLEQNIHERAIEYFIESISLFKELDNHQRIVLPYSGISSVLVEVGEIEQAQFYVQEGIKVALEYDNRLSLAYLYETAGNIQLEKNHFDSARVYYTDSAMLLNQIGNRAKYFDIIESIARLDFELGNYSSAKAQLDEIVRSFDDLEDDHSLFKETTYELLAKTEQALGNHARGLEFALLSKAISDSLNHRETALKVSELEAEFETAKKDNEILILTYENEAARLRIILISILGLGLVLLISIFYRESLKRKSLQKAFEMKSLQKELEQYGILLNEKNTYMTKVVEKLSDLNVDIKTSTGKRNLYNLIDSLKLNIAASESEEVMFKKIEQVNAGFFRALRSENQDLSSSEKRLASLVQMDLSSKDIANILHINPKSVNQAKYRLKKKLNIHPEIDLKEYLNSLVT